MLRHRHAASQGDVPSHRSPGGGSAVRSRAFSKQYGVVVVLKNNRTVIAEGDRIAINPTGSPALAKAGSGDALAGFITGLAARLSPFEAAVVGCFIHGRAGEIAAEEMGEYAPDATDIIARLSSAMLSV